MIIYIYTFFLSLSLPHLTPFFPSCSTTFLLSYRRRIIWWHACCAHGHHRVRSPWILRAREMLPRQRFASHTFLWIWETYKSHLQALPPTSPFTPSTSHQNQAVLHRSPAVCACKTSWTCPVSRNLESRLQLAPSARGRSCGTNTT